MSWTRKINHPSEVLKKGDEVEAVVLGIDTERERISLGIKQLGGDPFSSFAGNHEKGTLVKGTVKSVDATCALPKSPLNALKTPPPSSPSATRWKPSSSAWIARTAPSSSPSRRRMLPRPVKP